MISTYVKILLTCLLLSCADNNKLVNPELSGKVIAVKDGDTIEILHDGKPLRIRLAHIDCPEIRNSQPFGKAAKAFTSEMCFGKQVTVLNEGEVDRYGRLIAVVISEDGLNVNKELVSAGLAWYFLRYSSDTSYARLELSARQNKLGLWVDENPTPPWDWRKPTPGKKP